MRSPAEASRATTTRDPVFNSKNVPTFFGPQLLHPHLPFSQLQSFGPEHLHFSAGLSAAGTESTVAFRALGWPHCFMRQPHASAREGTTHIPTTNNDAMASLYMGTPQKWDIRLHEPAEPVKGWGLRGVRFRAVGALCRLEEKAAKGQGPKAKGQGSRQRADPALGRPPLALGLWPLALGRFFLEPAERTVLAEPQH